MHEPQTIREVEDIVFGIVTAAIAPSMAMLSYFYIKNEYGTTPFGLVFRVFLVGALVMFPVMVLQYAFTTEGFFQGPIYRAFILYGFVEEFFKWFLLYFFVFKQIEFSRHYDGIIFGVALSLGFASMENVLYLVANGVETAIGRALLPVSSHAIFGIIMGYYLGRGKLEPMMRRRWVVFSLLFPVVLHGVYDSILIVMNSYFLYGMIPFMFMLWWLAIKKVKLAYQFDR